MGFAYGLSQEQGEKKKKKKTIKLFTGKLDYNQFGGYSTHIATNLNEKWKFIMKSFVRTYLTIYVHSFS